MKFRIQNLGIVTEAEVSLNDLTIIAGPNNSGKTYITYTLYGLLNEWRKWINFEKALSLVDQIVENGSTSIPIKDLEKCRDEALGHLSSIYSNEIHNIFNDNEKQLSGAKVFLKNLSMSKLVKSPIKYKIGESINIEGQADKNHFTISLVSNKNVALPPRVILKDVINRMLGEFLFSENIFKPIIFTSERLGISLFYKELDAAKNALVGELQRLDKDNESFNPFAFLEKLSSWYASPIKDEIQFTRAIQKIQKNSILEENKSITDIIRRMIGGYYKHVGNDLRFISISRKNKFDIPLYLASSSARGLAGIFFFIKYVAKPGMIMMIDEPESHLNPSNQVEFARLISLCVNNGIKVFITTHSDYIIKELNNLIMLSNSFDEKSDFYIKNKKYYNSDMELNPDRINAYLCKNGKIHTCETNKFGMIIPSFDESIDQINRISEELELYNDSENAE